MTNPTARDPSHRLRSVIHRAELGRFSYLRLALAAPLLVTAWALLAAGTYNLGLFAFPTARPGASSLAAVWEFIVSFGASAVAVLVASRKALLARPTVRKVFVATVVASGTPSLCCLVIGSIAWLAN